jgi:hypothetical protein
MRAVAAVIARADECQCLVIDPPAALQAGVFPVGAIIMWRGVAPGRRGRFHAPPLYLFGGELLVKYTGGGVRD